MLQSFIKMLMGTNVVTGVVDRMLGLVQDTLTRQNLCQNVAQ